MNIAVSRIEGFAQPGGTLSSAVHKLNLQQISNLNGVKRRLTKNSILLHEEDEIKHVYEVVSGTVKALKFLADGRRQIIGFFGAGDIIGLPLETSAFYSIQAVKNTVVLCYPISQLDAAMGHSSALTKFIFGLVHSELERHLDHMISLGRKRPKERMAAFLLTYYKKQLVTGVTDMVIELPMSRVDIADYLGLTQETVCRVLGHFKRNNLIAAKNSHEIKILDLPHLEYIAQSGVLH